MMYPSEVQKGLPTGEPEPHPETGEVSIMAARTKAPAKSKTQVMFDLLDADPDLRLSEAARKADMGYSFAYGRAQTRKDPANPGQTYAESRCERRNERRVTTLDNGTIKIRVPQGFVLVTEAGVVTRTKK